MPRFRKLDKCRNLPSQREVPKVQPIFLSNINTVAENYKHSTYSTDFSYSSHNLHRKGLARLSAAIERKDLNDCLQILEEVGFRSEIALFALASIQQSLEVGL